MTWIKIGIVAAMIAIVFSLGSGLFYLVADKGQSRRTVKALTWRISLSIILFLLVVLGLVTGVITPNPPPIGQ